MRLSGQVTEFKEQQSSETPSDSAPAINEKVVACLKTCLTIKVSQSSVSDEF